MSPDRRRALLISAAALAVYLSNGRVITDGDSFATRLVPLALWSDGTVQLDRYAVVADRVLPGKPYNEPYWLARAPNGSRVSRSPLVTPMLVAPLYLPAVLAAGGDVDAGEADALAVPCEKGAAATLAAASVGLLYLLLRHRLAPADATLLTVAYALGTTTWAISSQALWQHGASGLLMIAVLLCAEARPSAPRLAAAGALIGLLAANRPSNAAVAVPLLLAMVWRGGWRRGAAAPIAAILAWAPFAVYNNRVFGHVIGGYAVAGLQDPGHPFYANPVIPGLLGTLFSPGKGLFVFSPFLLFLAVAACLPLADASWPARPVRLALLTGGALLLLVVARVDWRGGGCYGPRYMTELLPIAIVLFAGVVPRLGRSRPLFAAAVVLSVAIQAVGAYCYPAGRSDERFYPPGEPRLPVHPAVWRPGNAPMWVELRGCVRRMRAPGTRVSGTDGRPLVE